jgi:tRNA threonylcarbamoyladenosine biosynthesis protein TsaB
VTASVLLAIDTATTRCVVAIGSMDGGVLTATDWPAGYRHGETLLPAIEGALAASSLERHAIAAIVIGIGPGAFTGLRVGLATAKGLAHGLGRPIIGVPTGIALLAAAALDVGVAAEDLTLLLPAGPSERIVVRTGVPAALMPAGQEPALGPDGHLVAVDLEGRAPDEANARGERARAGLAARLLSIGAARLAAGDVDDLDGLVPVYVTLPRGAAPASGEVTWSRDLR